MAIFESAADYIMQEPTQSMHNGFSYIHLRCKRLFGRFGKHCLYKDSGIELA